MDSRDAGVVASFAHELTPNCAPRELRSLLLAIRRTHLIVGAPDPTTQVLEPNACLKSVMLRRRLTRVVETSPAKSLSCSNASPTTSAPESVVATD